MRRVCYSSDMENLTRMSFGFTEEDMRILEECKANLRDTDGSVTNIAVIRKSLRTLLMIHNAKKEGV